ncbi:hypothetical protein LTR37_006761 [Vermiconidia calcicola]|uniref:Uncharacterized protein n=1 Tax=Vermiconidia calcicola TaxID=1690605 RepID=A0ACC3NIF9_9PEZI|nr:hypothetical protein LTR37_006761 [Vermiconidia calcicola]
MPPSPSISSTYFPPLDKCLVGDDRLISWKTAYRAFCDPEVAAENTALEAFITDPESTHFLSNAFEPFLQRGAKTKGDFETKTAPIHVSQSANGDYNLEELKNDALWLAEKANVEELVALRVCILEWQQRAEDGLLAVTTGSGSTAAGGTTDYGASALGASTLSLAATVNGAASPAMDFGKEEIRRERQLQVYRDEKSYILKICVDLVSRLAVDDDHSKTGRTWIDELACKVAGGMQCSPKTDATGHETFPASCIDILDKAIQKLGDSSKWPEAFKSDERKQTIFATATFTDITSALRLLLTSLHISQSIQGPNILLAWFKLMDKVNFFQDLGPSSGLSDASTIQCLASIVSATILRVPEVLNRIQESALPLLDGSGVSYPRLEGSVYFQNDACVRELNLILNAAAEANIVVASPALYAWSILTSSIRDVAKLMQQMREQARVGEDEDGSEDGSPNFTRRRSSRREPTRDEMSVFEKQYMQLQDFELEGEAREDPPAFFAKASVDRMGVFAVVAQLSSALAMVFASEVEAATAFIGRSALFELMREGIPMVSYGEEVVDAVLAILSPDAHGRANELDSRLANRFLSASPDSDNDIFRRMVLEQALARYPFEISPLLRLLTALSSANSARAAGPTDLVQMLETLQTLTVMVPESFRDYMLDHEDENMNNIVLTDTLPLFISRQALCFYGVSGGGRKALTMGDGETERSSNVLAIPSGTAGIVVKESRPMVFRLEHPHSGLEYLGLLLSTILPNSELYVASSDHVRLDRSTAADILTLIISLLKSSSLQHQGAEEARFVLGRLGYALHDEQDIVSVISNILEMELLAHLDQSIADGSLDLLVACAEFFGGANALAAVVGVTEVQIGRYRFLGACVSMYANLIDDAISGLVKRRAKVNKSTNRFDSPMSSQDNTPERTMSSVLSAFQTVMVDAWQSLAEWRFALRNEKAEVSALITKAFERLLKSAYGVVNDGKDGISALLVPAARILMDAIAPIDGNGQALKTFAQVFMAGTNLEETALTTQERKAAVEAVNAAARFLTTLIKTRRMDDEESKSAYSLATQLLNLMPTLATLLATYHDYKLSLTTLLTETVQSANSNHPGTDQPSILGSLSVEAAKSFLSVISQLDRPLRDLDTESGIWNFLSGIMQSKQQWFAIYLLTGSIPKDRLVQEPKDGKDSSKSLLLYALDQLSNITTLPPERAMNMLKFIASALKAWVWATHEVRSHSQFLKSVLDWLNGLQPPSRAPNLAEEMILASEHQMAAYLCDILALNLHAALETGRRGDNATILKSLVPKLAFLRDHAVNVNAYNRSLHRNLADNFTRKFPGCDVDDFRRTPSNPAQFGRQFFYDLELANRVLGHEMAWHGAGLSIRNQGFAEEFARANVNLSLVHAQKELLTGWRLLATTLCECVDEDEALQSELAKTTERCLRANAEANLEIPGMNEVVILRMDMTFVILSKLVAVKVGGKEVKNILPAIWNLVRVCLVDYDVATAAEDLRYYRTLLQVLYLALQPHVHSEPANATTNRTRTANAADETHLEFLDPTVAAILVEIVARTIAPGFRALCGNLHTSIALAQPADFALLTAILRALLAVKGVETVSPQISDIIATSSLVRGALSLYSWADQLAEHMDDRDPVYGEVAMNFLLTLSSIPSVAEQMAAVDGVLVQLSSANVSSYLLKPNGKGPFDEPRRMFNIWRHGFLPLCLNLLDAVGPAIAADISAFLNGFPEQLKRAETALENRAATPRNPHAGAVTLGLVSEAHSLCLIALILASDISRGAADGINAADVPKLNLDYEKVKEDVASLVRQKTSLASRIVPVGVMEERWRQSDVAGYDSSLVSKVVGEIVELLRCFGEGAPSS